MNPIGDLYSLPLDQLPVVVLDLETTGLHSHQDAICEVGAVLWKGNQIISSFSSLVNPQRDIPERVVEIHQLTPEILKDAPLIHEVIPTFLQFIGNAAIAGHNAAFDLGFLAPVVHPLGISLNTRPILDTASLARRLLPGQKGYALFKLAASLDLPNTRFHRALDDATTTAYLLQRLFQEAQKQGIHTLAALEEAYPPKVILSKSETSTELEKTIWNAIEHTLTLDIRYCNRDGEVRERTISPQRLEPPYLYAFCHLREEQRCFRLNRIEEFKVATHT